MEGKLRSEIEGVRNDISGEKGNILRNPSFASNTYYWDTKSLVHYIPVKDGWLWLPSSFYVDKETYVGMYRDGNRRVLRILNSSVGQANDLMDIPMHSNPSEDGKYTYSFSFHYRVLRQVHCVPGCPDRNFTKKKVCLLRAVIPFITIPVCGMRKVISTLLLQEKY